MELVVVKHNAGNVFSVCSALDRLGCSYRISSDAEEIGNGDKVILPGVGEASSAMNYLQERKLDQAIKNLRQPILGICLGMQLLCKRTEENNTECLGVFDETVKRFQPLDDFKVPHMGWNTITGLGAWIDSSLEGSAMYFVHSYYVALNRNTDATTQYTIPFSAAIRKDNFYGVQFHPEKSGSAGERLLKSFLEL